MTATHAAVVGLNRAFELGIRDPVFLAAVFSRAADPQMKEVDELVDTMMAMTGSSVTVEAVRLEILRILAPLVQEQTGDAPEPAA